MRYIQIKNKRIGITWHLASTQALSIPAIDQAQQGGTNPSAAQEERDKQGEFMSLTTQQQII